MPSRGNNNSSTEPSSERTVQEKNHKLWLHLLALVGLLALIAAFSRPAAKIIALVWEKVQLPATPWFSWITTFWGQAILLFLYLISIVLFLFFLFEIAKRIACACGSTTFFKWLRNKDQGSITPTLFKSVLVFAALGVGGGIVTYNVSDNGPAWVELIAGAFTATGAMFAALLLFHRGEEDRRSRESTAREELRTRRREGFGERMSTAIDHLISTNIGARAAGMVELAALADDWHALAEEAKQDVDSEREKKRLTDESRRRQQELVDLIFKQPLPALKPEATDVEIKSLQRTRSLIISNHCNGEENNWSFINFERAELSHAELSGKDLSGWNLRGAKLNFAVLRSVKLNNASLIHAQLNNAKLKKVQLNNASLVHAQLNNANLRRTELNNANLSRAQLKNADLRDVHLKEASFSETIYSSGTSFPDGFDPNDTD